MHLPLLGIGLMDECGWMEIDKWRAYLHSLHRSKKSIDRLMVLPTELIYAG